MSKIVLTRFDGGERTADLPSEFSDGEWAQLRNLVFEGGHSSVRTVWPLQTVLEGTVTVGMGSIDAADIEQVWILDGEWLVVHVNTDGWHYAELPGTTDSDPEITELTAVTGSPPAAQSGVGMVPAFGGTAVRTKQGILLNGVNASSAGVIRDDGTNPDFHTITERYPNTPDDGAALPKANLGIMWGDFLVLGDIEWLEDTDATFESSNAEQYVNGLWFSQPSNTFRWHIDDVEFVGPRFSEIVDMAVIEAGLLVGTTTGAWILRGTPILHEIVRLSDVEVEQVTTWSAAGGGAWTQVNGEVWWTDGLTSRRLDRIIEPSVSLVTLGEHDAFIAAQGASLDTLAEHDTDQTGNTLLDHDRNPLHE